MVTRNNKGVIASVIAQSVCSTCFSLSRDYVSAKSGKLVYMSGVATIGMKLWPGCSLTTKPSVCNLVRQFLSGQFLVGNIIFKL